MFSTFAVGMRGDPDAVVDTLPATMGDVWSRNVDVESDEDSVCAPSEQRELSSPIAFPFSPLEDSDEDLVCASS